MKKFRLYTLIAGVMFILPAMAIAQPSLLVTKSEMAALKEKIRTSPWAAESYNTLKSRVDNMSPSDLEIPDRGANWPAYYADPENGMPLRTGKPVGKWKWEHINPKTGKVYRGDPSDPRKDLDGAILYSIHQRLGDKASLFGLMYQLTDEARYATVAKSILWNYASRYRDLPVRNKEGGSELSMTGAGKVFVQSLDEAIWLLQLAVTADFIWEVLSENERKELYDQLFKPASELIMAHEIEVHNIQCWKNAAIGAVGFLYGRKELQEHALYNEKSGYTRQVQEGLTENGLWWEMSPAYHYYSFYPLWVLSQIASNNGIIIDWDPLKKMLVAPLNLATTSLDVPAFNDGKAINLTQYAHYYEWGYAKFGDRSYLSVLNASDRSALATIPGQFPAMGLLYGEPSVPKDTASQGRQPVNFEDSGIAVFRTGEGSEELMALVKYKNPVSYHTHPEQLGIILYKGNAPVLVDPGSVAYGSSLQTSWYKAALAHNTVVINKSEPEVREIKDHNLSFNPEENTGMFSSRRKGESEFIRAVVMLDDSRLLIFDRITVPSKQILDHVLHINGSWEKVPAGRPVDFETPPYSHFIKPITTPGGEQFYARAQIEGKMPVGISSATLRPSVAVVGTAPGPKDDLPFMMIRSESEFQVVATLIHLDTNENEVRLEMLATGIYLVTLCSTGERIVINFTHKPFSDKNISIGSDYIQRL